MYTRDDLAFAPTTSPAATDNRGTIPVFVTVVLSDFDRLGISILARRSETELQADSREALRCYLNGA